METTYKFINAYQIWNGKISVSPIYLFPLVIPMIVFLDMMENY